MNLRESGMPDEVYWESLFDAPLILDRLGIDGRLGDVIELGCGYGTFTIPVAERISGVMDTCDVEPEMIERTQQRTAEAALYNVHCHHRDVLVEGFGVPDESRDATLGRLRRHQRGPRVCNLLDETECRAANACRLGKAGE